jgi:hypothetical protein
MVMGLEGNLEIKVVNFVLVDVLFFQLERYILVSESFGVPFRGCTVYIYIIQNINSINIISIQIQR